jgi:ATP-dependent RNA helicase DeaD
MNYPIRVSAQHYVDKVNLIQEYYKIPENKKLSLLVDLLSKNKDKKAIVFCNTRSNVDMVEHNLIANGIESYKLHGGLEQRKRTHITALYHKHKSAILVSTDVAARGIHIEDVEYIYNFDLPKEKTQYIHRIGRTARAGKQGKAISFVSQRNLDEFLKMGKKYKFDIKKKELPDFKQLDLIKVKNGFLGRSSKGSLRDLSSRSNRKELYTSKKKSYFDKRINMFKKEIEDSKNKQLDRKENKQKYFNEKEEKFKKKQIFDRIKYKKKLRQKKYSK